jgi:hypothetical protein
MHWDTTSFVMGPASSLLDLSSLRTFSAVALRAIRGAVPAIHFNRVLRPAWFRRSEPSLFQKCLAVHIDGAEGRSALQ